MSDSSHVDFKKKKEEIINSKNFKNEEKTKNCTAN